MTRPARTALGLVAALALGSLFASAATAAPKASSGRASLNLYFQSNLKDEAYQKKTFDRVAKAWKAPAKGTPKTGAKTVVQAVITKPGKLGSLGVSTSSGSKDWDDAVLAAVKRAAPFDPLPAGFPQPSVEVHVHVSVVP